MSEHSLTSPEYGDKMSPRIRSAVALLAFLAISFAVAALGTLATITNVDC